MHLYNCIGVERVFIFDHLCVLFGCFPLRLITRSCFPFFVSFTTTFLAQPHRHCDPRCCFLTNLLSSLSRCSLKLRHQLSVMIYII
ncbi:hypothetical protein Hanom_Chr03g00203381 [Helianthus anomalus]